MNVVTVLGSPRKEGNSSSIAMAFTRKAQSMGAHVSVYYLNGMNFQGCQGCMSCKKQHEHCILKDDLTALLEDIVEADAVVMASPIYYHTVTGQFKTFFDRTFSFLKPNFFNRPDPCRLPQGKKGLLILSQGQGETEFHDVVDQYQYFMEAYGMGERHVIRAVKLVESSSAEDRQLYVDEAVALAQTWC
ncbi:flavodoxin family protein [Desulfovibrio inopinatus]|uniref:flavodoxin family protein n=1 Tax=Desulfovibrio inopinatus TaxID=102109 RepID=UPI0004018C11|nr:flavodoxin family protein [Desulfovibrio inopinatus]